MLERFLQSNVMQWFATRKFGSPIEMIAGIALLFAMPDMGIPITLEVQVLGSLFFMLFTLITLWGDIKYDHLNAQKNNPPTS